MNKQDSNFRKIFKAFAVSFVAMVALFFVIALFKSKTYEVTQKIEIQVPVEKVFPLVADLSQWKNWSPWYEVQPSADYVFEGTPMQVGSSLKWDGKIIGNGKMTLTESKANEMVMLKIDFNEPRKAQSVSEFRFEARGATTLVTWTDKGILSYPFGRLFGDNISQMLAKDFEEGLKKLKSKIEN